MKSPRSAWWGVSIVPTVAAWLIVVAIPTVGEGGQRHGGGTVTGSAVPVASPAPVASPPPVAAPPASGGGARSGGTGSASAGSDRSNGDGRRDGGGVRAGTAAPRDSGARTSGTTGSGTESRGESQGVRDSGATGRRTRRGGDVVGTAVPRTVPIRTGGGSVIFVPGGYGFYPWGYGGLGFGGYYGGYYSSYYDPWYPGGYSTYYSARDDDDGALRLKVKPRDASVYLDGYYVGLVEDFNGVFQRLHLGSGPHRIEIRQPKYESLAFDVRIEPGETVTYHGDLRKSQ